MTAACAGIIGGNGSGKSTLFRMLMGEEQPDGGDLVLGETVQLMYSEQSREGLDGERTVRAPEQALHLSFPMCWCPGMC